MPESKEYDHGAKDWRTKGRLDAGQVANRDYRRGAQDQRTEQVDAELRRLGGKP
jgi:hypothetical protein